MKTVTFFVGGLFIGFNAMIGWKLYLLWMASQ